MGNRLKEMLDKKNNRIAFTMYFSNAEDRSNFINAINKVGVTGKPKKVPVPQFMEKTMVQGDFQYPLEHIENIVDMVVYLSEGLINIPVLVDGVKDTYSFLRNINEDTVHLSAVNSKIADVKLELHLDDNIMIFTSTLQPRNADSMDELIYEYKKFIVLIDSLFEKNKTPEKLEDMKKHCKYLLNFYIMAKELCKILEINLTPNMVMDEDDGELLIEKYYLLLVRKSIIRIDDKLNYIKTADAENIEIGQQLFAVYHQNIAIEIFGKRKELYTANCIFGAEIQKVESKDDGSNVLYFKDSGKNPMYRAYSAFLDKNDAEEETHKIIEKREQYENAVSLAEQLRNLLQV